MPQQSSAASYKIKRVHFFDREVQIFTQNLNGPCPLLAIANVLSLRDEIKLPRDAPDISESKLIALVAEHYLDTNAPADDRSEYALNLQQNLNDGLQVLHKLRTGIDVNVKFDSPDGFELTPEVVIFDLLRISLLHGWLVDPQDLQTAIAFGDKSYNEVVELLVELEAPADSTSAAGNIADDTITSIEGVLNLERTNTEDELQQALALSLTVDDSHTQHPEASECITGGGDKPAEERGETVCAPSVEERTASNNVVGDVPSAVVAESTAADTPTTPQITPDDVPSREADSLQEASSSDAFDSSPAVVEPQPDNLPKHNAAAAAAAERNEPGNSEPEHSVTEQSQPASSKPKITEQDQHQLLLLRNFLDTHCSQLTIYGLTQLCDTIKEHELAVFFRNNHFCTIFRHQSQLYLLVTDQGYLSEPDVVWERLDAVDGDTQLCTCDFEPFVPGLRQETPPVSEHVDSDADFALALQLQEEERIRQEEHDRRVEQQRRQQQVVPQHLQQQQQHRPQHAQQQHPPAAVRQPASAQQQAQQPARAQPFARLIPAGLTRTQSQQRTSRLSQPSSEEKPCSIM